MSNWDKTNELRWLETSQVIEDELQPVTVLQHCGSTGKTGSKAASRVGNAPVVLSLLIKFAKIEPSEGELARLRLREMGLLRTHAA